MAKFLVLYLAPHAVVDEWMKTPPEKRKTEEDKMMTEWKRWTSEHSSMFADKGPELADPSEWKPTVPRTRATTSCSMRS